MKLSLLVPALIVALCPLAHAEILTFDDLPEDIAPIPDGYGGLIWNDIFAGNFTEFSAVVSPPNVAAVGGPETSFGRNRPFRLNSGYFMSAFDGTFDITVLGFAGNTQKFSKTFTLTATPTLETFNFSGITQVVIETEDPLTFDNLSLSLGLHFTAGLNSNQLSIATSIDTAGDNAPASFTHVNNALSALSALGLASALDELSPLKFGHFASTTAFNNASFETQDMDSYLADQRGGRGGAFMAGNGQIDSRGLTVNDPNIDPSLAMVHSRLLAWNAPGGMADVASPALGGIDMKNMKSTYAPVAPNPWNFFVRGNVVLAQGFSQTDIPHFDDNTESVVLGADYRVTPNFLVGLTAAYSHTDATLDASNSSATIDAYSPGIYASYANEGWYLNAIGRYSYNSYTEERAIDFLHQKANGGTDGNEGVANLDGGYDFHSGSWTYGPTSGLQYVHLAVNSYTEANSDANLNVREDRSDSLRSRVGGTVRYAFTSSRMTFTPHLSASWVHEFMDQSRGITSQFSSFSSSDFVVRTPESSDDFALVDAGLEAQIGKSVNIFGDYLIQAGQDNYFGQSVQAGVKVNF